MRSLRLALVAFILVTFARAQDFASQADAYISALVQQNKFSGTVLAAKDGKPVFRKGYLLANREWNIPNAPDTKFRLGSITKQFTATAILESRSADSKPVRNASATQAASLIKPSVTVTNGLNKRSRRANGKERTALVEDPSLHTGARGRRI